MISKEKQTSPSLLLDFFFCDTTLMKTLTCWIYSINIFPLFFKHSRHFLLLPRSRTVIIPVFNSLLMRMFLQHHLPLAHRLPYLSYLLTLLCLYKMHPVLQQRNRLRHTFIVYGLCILSLQLRYDRLPSLLLLLLELLSLPLWRKHSDCSFVSRDTNQTYAFQMT